MADNSGLAVQPAPVPANADAHVGDDQPGKGNSDPSRNASQIEITIFGVYLLTLGLLLFYLLLKLMPGKASDPGPDVINLFGMSWPHVWLETRFVLLALCAGAMGSFIHTATSFADFVGNKQLVKSWLWWYLLRPFIGSCLAVILYFVMRAGLISLGQGNVALDSYRIVTVSALAGMFAKQATDKLREIFENLFKATTPPRSDALKATDAAAGAAAGKK